MRGRERAGRREEGRERENGRQTGRQIAEELAIHFVTIMRFERPAKRAKPLEHNAMQALDKTGAECHQGHLQRLTYRANTGHETDAYEIRII